MLLILVAGLGMGGSTAGTANAVAFAAPGWTFASGPPARFVAFTPQPGGAAAILLLHF